MTNSAFPSGFRVSREALAPVCERNGIRRLALFGSRLRGTARPDSDVDLLAEFLPDAPVGYLAMARIENELSDLFGTRVDLRTAAELSRYFRSEVEEEALELYAA